MNRRSIALAALAVVLAAVPAASARAAGGDGALEIRIYDVGALVSGRPDFVPERGPFSPSPDQVNDEERPFFGLEAEETLKPLGAAEDLIELVKANDAPGTWEREGSSIAAMGASRIVVKQSAAVHDRVAALLLGLEKETLTTVVLDVVAVTGDAAPGTSFADAVVSGALRPVAAARASGFVGQRITAFHGSERSYLEDHDVEVAQNAKTSDPIVGIQKEGLSIDVRVSRADDVVNLTLDAWLARVTDMASRDAGVDPIDLPVVDGRTARAQMRLKPGVWAWASTGGDVSFAVRATVLPFEDRGTDLVSLRTSGDDLGDGQGEMKDRRFAFSDLAAKAENRRGKDLYLTPSNYTPPEPPELPEPMPAFPPDALADLAKATDSAAWEREGARIETKNDILYARHDERHLAAIGRLLDDLRARYLRQPHVRSRVVAVPASWVPDWWTDGAGTGDGAALLALPGARVVGRASMRMHDDSRMASVGGVSHRYVGDWDVEIAEGVSIGNPLIREFLEGYSLDVHLERALAGGAYACDARLDRSVWRGVRDVTTRHGLLECPNVGVSRFHGSLMLPAGATRIVAAGLEGDEMLFILLTVTED